MNTKERRSVLADCTQLRIVANLLRQQAEAIGIKLSATARKESAELYRLAAVVNKVSDREAQRANANA